MKVIIVGAGATGQVYGRHLALGGAQVTYLVKPKYEAEARRGFTLYALNERDATTPLRFEDCRIVTSVEEVAAETWDQAWLTVAAPAIFQDWLPPFLEAIGEAPVVSLTAGADVRDHLLAHLPPERLVLGLVALIAYQAPLPGETRFPEPGVAYWFPPLGASGFSGAFDPVSDVVSSLRQGGQPARQVSDATLAQLVPNALLMPHLLALEQAGWSFDRFRERERLALASRAAREAIAIGARRHGISPPASRLLARPLVLRLALGASRVLIPLDIERYIEFHFTKVRSQTLLHVRRFVEVGREQGLPTEALETLCGRVEAC